MTAATAPTAGVDGHGDDGPRDRLTLAVLVGSVRVGRLGPSVAGWFLDRARQRPEWSTDLIDLVDLDLPADLDGGGHTAALAARIGAADAIVVVTPEYNHAYPGALKTAIDTVREQWSAKPVGFVSYGGTAGGLRAVEQLRLVFAELHTVTVRETVSFAAVHHQFDEHGALTHPDRAEASAAALLDRLTWWARALARARAEAPFST